MTPEQKEFYLGFSNGIVKMVNLRKQVNACWIEMRPEYIAIINKMIDETLKNCKGLIVDVYKMIKDIESQ